MKKNQLLQTLGTTLMNCGQIDEAIQIYSDLVSMEPKNSMASLTLADLFLENQKIELAIDTVRDAIPFSSNISISIELWNKLGNLYILNNDHGKVIKVFQKVDELTNSLVNNPVEKKLEVSNVEIVAEQMSEDSPHVWNELGLILHKVGCYDDAADAYINGLKIDSSLPFLHMNLAQVYVNQGKLEEAITEFETLLGIVESNEEKINLWTRILSCYKLQGESEKMDLTKRILAGLTKSATSKSVSYMELTLDQIEVSPNTPQANLDELVRSIRNHGVIQPLIVSPIEKSDKFQLVAGNRRLAAAKSVGLTTIPVIVRKVSEVESIELSLHENLHNTIKGSEELATNFQKLATDHDYSIEDIANRIGVSTFSVANSLKAPLPNRTVREKAIEEKSVEKELIMKMIGCLGNGIKISDSNAVLAPEIEMNSLSAAKEDSGLWYMEANTTITSIPVSENKHTGLFARAFNVLSHNPHPAKLNV